MSRALTLANIIHRYLKSVSFGVLVRISRLPLVVQSVLLLGSDQSGSAAAVVVAAGLDRGRQFVMREQKIFQLVIQWIIQ
jgi:hypothetical protein